MSNDKSFGKSPSLTQLQYLVWACVLLVSFFAMLLDGVQKSIVSAVVNTCFYALIIYGNISFLYPRFYQKKKYLIYILGALVLLLIAGFGRGYTSEYIYRSYFHRAPRVMDAQMHLSFFISGLMVFVLSFIFRIAMAYFALKQRSDEIMAQRSQFELNLLKAQVQPHFLFNTLNNIYYEAYQEAPRTALLVEKLSNIMRYFVDEAPAELVPIGTEVIFLENYISLETIRIRHGINLEFEKEFSNDIKIPPMLLMTFVENIFKHGIDKTRTDNHVWISLKQVGEYLIFETRNADYSINNQKNYSGLGILNLRKRLTILFGNKFELKTAKLDGNFIAFMKIPLA